MQNNNSNQKNCSIFPNGETLTIVAATAANLLASDLTNKEISVLSLFFNMLSDSLATIAAANILLSQTNTDTDVIIEQRRRD